MAKAPNQATYRIGFGYDLHTFDAQSKKPLMLGGVLIPNHYGVRAHSDGDVVLHAIIDALLGAAGLGDIGQCFPDTDPKWENCPSTHMLLAVKEKIQAHGYTIENIDTTIITETPKITPYRSLIQKAIGKYLSIGNDQISIKSTTHEGVGAIGAKKAIAVHAVCLLIRQSE